MSSSRIIDLVTRGGSAVVESIDELLAEAETLGKVEIGHKSFSDSREVTITMGEWGEVYVRVTAHGFTVPEALRNAIQKARRVKT